jgi:hypothetical protein
MMTRIRQWLEISLVLAIAALVVYFIFFRGPSYVPVPGATQIIEKIKGIEALDKKMDDLSVQIKKQQAQGKTDIEVALRETDIQKSVARMNANW